MQITPRTLAAAALLLAAPLAALAQQPTHVHDHPQAEGEVRKVDAVAGRITLRHGEIAAVDMPGMTMTFPVRDRAALEQLQPGDRVRFDAAEENGQIVVTRIEPAR